MTYSETLKTHSAMYFARSIVSRFSQISRVNKGFERDD